MKTCRTVMLAALMMAQPAWAGPPFPTAQATVTRLDDARFDARFMCPETLTPSQSDQEMSNFIGWVVAQHPKWTVADTVRARYVLLVKHKCSATLEAIRQHAERQNRKE